jgi:Zn-dependent peptidase ImmA (M78 family)
MAHEKKLINNLAESFRNALGISGDDFDIEKVVSDIGGKIEYDKNFCTNEEVTKTGDDSFLIKIGKHGDFSRARFSIARELGRLFMHMHYGSEDWNRLTAGETSEAVSGKLTMHEEDVNSFSAAFLMPENRFLEIARETSDDKFHYPSKIAEHFGVYEDAVIYRGKSLGLWR